MDWIALPEPSNHPPVACSPAQKAADPRRPPLHPQRKATMTTSTMSLEALALQIGGGDFYRFQPTSRVALVEAIQEVMSRGSDILPEFIAAMLKVECGTDLGQALLQSVAVALGKQRPELLL